MSTVWRFTGPPENWITALTIKKWALNDTSPNPSTWRKIRPKDIVLFHSTGGSDFTKTKPSIIGYGYVGEKKYRKVDYWWIQEIVANVNLWPNVINFETIFTFSDISKIDLQKAVQDKTRAQVSIEIKLILKDALRLGYIENAARIINPNSNKFPVNGSASRVNEIYKKIVLGQERQIYKLSPESGKQEEVWFVEPINVVENKLEPTEIDRLVDTELAKARSQVELERIIQQIEDKYKDKEPQTKKRISIAIVRNPWVALLIKERANYICQLCNELGFEKEDGTRYAEVHHIEELGKSGPDIPSNMICVCPKCHRIIHYGSQTEKNKLNFQL